MRNIKLNKTMVKILLTNLELKQIAKNFQDFLKTNSSTETVLPKGDFVQNNEKFQAMIMGGTNFHSGLFEFQNNELITYHKSKTDMQLIQSLDQFAMFFTQHLEDSTNKVILNFTFPIENLERNGYLDAILLRNSKGYNFGELVGQEIGQCLERIVLERYNRSIQVAIINDMIPLIKSGISRPWQYHGAMIVGTGLNLGYFQSNAKIVIIEPQRFRGYEYISTQESEIAGAYLFKIYNQITNSKLENTEDLDTLAEKGDVVARQIFERSSSLAAALIAGLYDFLELGPHKMFLDMEGSLFWHGYKYQENVTKYLEILGITEAQIEITHNLDPLLATACLAKLKK